MKTTSHFITQLGIISNLNAKQFLVGFHLLRKAGANFVDNEKFKWLVRNMACIMIIIGVALHLKKNFMYAIDDSYITFRYAQNFAEGYGLCFNTDERHFGSTAMGFAVILGVMSYIINALTDNSLLVKEQIATSGVLIPVLANLLSAVSIGVIVFSIFKIGDYAVGPLKSFAITLFFTILLFVAPYTNNVSGHETYIYVALLCFSLYSLFILNRFFTSGLLIGLASTLRPDSILMFLLILSILIIRYVVKQPAQKSCKSLAAFSGGFLLVMIPWMVFCFTYYGQVLPETLTAKKAQVLLGHWPLYTVRLILAECLKLLGYHLAFMIVISLLGAIIFLTLTHRSISKYFNSPLLCIIASLVAFSVGQVIFYSLIKVTFWHWYASAILIFLTVASAIATVALVFSLYAQVHIRRWVAIVILSVFISALLSTNRIGYWASQWVSSPRNSWEHIYSYDPIVSYLIGNEPLGTTIVTAEPGALGFKLGPKFKVIDELGLTSPGVARSIIKGNLIYPFTTWDPRYVIVSWDGKYTPHESNWFKEKYYLVSEFNHPYWQKSINRGAYLFKKRDTIPPEPK